MKTQAIVKGINELLEYVKELEAENKGLKEQLAARDLAELERQEAEEKAELAYFIRNQRQRWKHLNNNEFARMVGINTTALNRYIKEEGSLKNMEKVVNRIRELNRKEAVK